MNTALKYGLTGGILLSSFLIFYFFDLYESPLFTRFWTIFQLLVLMIVILLGVKEKKRKDNQEINYRDAVFTGLSINTIAAFIHSLALLVFFLASDARLQKFKSFIVKKETEAMQSLKMPAKKIQEYTGMIQKELTPLTIAKDNFMQILLLGLIFTLVIAFFQRNKAGNTPQIRQS